MCRRKRGSAPVNVKKDERSFIFSSINSSSISDFASASANRRHGDAASLLHLERDSPRYIFTSFFCMHHVCVARTCIHSFLHNRAKTFTVTAETCRLGGARNAQMSAAICVKISPGGSSKRIDTELIRGKQIMQAAITRCYKTARRMSNCTLRSE